ncbi:transglycosylase SLT domain-containing protein [Neptunomonas sp.]|uniref:transglycosylase SLT domain-containing protein n=1 Tax=Neptunomonas sp. TaxID=1971898 RepID=UPI0025E6EA82|nr:transglycosylase SLT domain-containing protein [Neptunomonas sp.]
MLKRRKLLSAVAIIGVAIGFSSPFFSAYASTPERQLYLKAKTAFEKKNTALADKLTDQLKNYPLAPYLHTRQIKRDIAKLDDAFVSSFIQANKTTPYADDVQKVRLNKLLRQKKWQSFNKAYAEFPINSKRYRCELANATFQLGQKKQAFIAAQQLWLVGYSQDSACNALFVEWIKQGNVTSSIASKRFWLAIENKNFDLAKYLARFINNPTHTKETMLFWDVKNKPDLIENTKLLKEKLPHHGVVAAYAIRKIARKDINKAANLWLRDRNRLMFSQKVVDKTNLYFGMRYAKGYRKNAEQVLGKLDPNFTYEKLTEWRIRLKLAKQDWKGALALIEKLPEKLQSEGRWAYWKESTTHRLNPQSHKPNYDEISKERSFYGFLASEITNNAFYLNHRPSGITTAHKNKVSNLPAFKRIKELLALDYQYAARVEWNHLSKQLSKNDKLAMAHIAYDWGWYDQAIRGAARIKAWDDLDIRFANPHQSLFKELSAKRGIYQTWAVAVARQESAWHQTARSRVGARGLMQLMPATAKMTAKRYDIKYNGVNQLFTPRTNISLGTAYLAEVLGTFKGNRVYATAAYNAGPHRVKKWLKARGNVPLDVWIETIPFDETRNYVQNVLAFSVIYDVMASKKASLFSKQESDLLALNQDEKNNSGPTL